MNQLPGQQPTREEEMQNLFNLRGNCCDIATQVQVNIRAMKKAHAEDLKKAEDRLSILLDDAEMYTQKFNELAVIEQNLKKQDEERMAESGKKVVEEMEKGADSIVPMRKGPAPALDIAPAPATETPARKLEIVGGRSGNGNGKKKQR